MKMAFKVKGATAYLGPGPVNLSKRQFGMGKNILEGFHSNMSLKMFPFTEATLCRMWEQWRTLR